MKLSRDWLSDTVDLSGLSDDELAKRFTEIGHAVESMEPHGSDTVFDLEITTNRVDAMSHLGMARELAAAVGRTLSAPTGRGAQRAPAAAAPQIRIEAPEMCRRYTALVIRGVTIKPSPEKIARRLESVGLRPINNVVDATNYVMLALGHPLHAFDLDRLQGPAIIVRCGKPGETLRSLDNEVRKLDPETVVIADAAHAVGLGGIIGGAESEITAATKNVLLECAWFEPSFIRRTARRLGIKTDASYRFERRVDPNDTVLAVELAAQMIGGTGEAPIDVVAEETRPKTLRLRTTKLHDQSGGAVGIGYALELFRRLGFAAESVHDGIRVDVPTYRGDIFEEMDLVEEVLRFFGLNNVPAAMPRVVTGDVRRERVDVVADEVRDVLVGCGLSETVSYSFIHPDHNAIVASEAPISRVREHERAALVMAGTVGTFWGDAKRAVDFFDVKGVVEQIAARLHVTLDFAAGHQPWLRKGKRAIARHGDNEIASLGFIAAEVLQRFGIKGDVAAADIDIDALIAATGEWKMAPVARYPGVPMILALTHERDLAYERIVDTIRSFDVPFLQEVGLRDRFVPEGEETIKTTLGMWYQAFDRSLTQEEVSAHQQQLAARLADMLPVKLL